jgi:hypothetical protein
VYGEPHQGRLWEFYETRIRVHNEGGHKEGVVAALQLYSDKTQVTHKGEHKFEELKKIQRHSKTIIILCGCQSYVPLFPRREGMPSNQGNAAEHYVRYANPQL